MKFENFLVEEHKSWMAINKPSGLIVERNPFEQPTIEDLALSYLEKQKARNDLGIIHRLDRVTSGILLLAKKRKALKALNKQFEQQSIQKTYLAVISQMPPEQKGRLEHWHTKLKFEKRATVSTKKKEGSHKVSLTYEILRKKDDLILLKIQPHTGKFHQIRIQLSSIGCPIVGDQKYGSSVDPHHRHIALHAWKISFIRPDTQEPYQLEAPIPEDKWWLSFKDEV